MTDEQEGRLPWVKWSFAALFTDAGLQSCSMAARYLWIHMIGLAYASPEPGVVLIGGRPPDTAQLAREVRSDPRAIPRLIQELEQAGVFSRDEAGRIYSRRIVRQVAVSARNTANGRTGGNPALLGPDHVPGKVRDKPKRPRIASNPAPIRGRAAAASQQVRSTSAAGLQQVCSRSAASPQQDCGHQTSLINTLSEKAVNPPVKADSESEKEKEKERKGTGPASLEAGASPAPGQAASDNVVVLRAAPPAPALPAAAAGPPGDRSWVAPKGMKQPSEGEWRALEAWNQLALANGNFRVGGFIPSRLIALRKRMAEVGGLDGFVAVLRVADGNPLWLGQAGKGWRPGFEDIVSAEKFTKLREGGYADFLRPRGAMRHQVAGDATDFLVRRAGYGRQGAATGDVPPVEAPPRGPVIDQDGFG